MNKVTHMKSEAGQIIVVIAFLLIAMIAMLGLAIDGGGLMFLQRDVQNAADASIVAGTYAICSGGNNSQVIDAARKAAKDQGFDHGVDGVTVDVDPAYVPPGGGANGVRYVKVDILAPKDTYFIQIVYTNELSISTSSVGRCNPIPTYFDFSDHAMVALGEDCSWDINSTGNSMTIHGNVYSNGDMKLAAGGAGVVVNGTVTYTGTGSFNNLTINPNVPPIDTNDPLPPSAFPPLFVLTDYEPGSVKALAAAADGNRYYSYTGNKTFQNITMEGLYYVTGDVKLNKVTVGPKGITIAMTGSLDVINNVKNQDFKPYIDTLNFFTTHVNHGCNSSGGLSVSGSDNVFSGIFYGPDTTVALSGSSNDACALIGYYVNPSGADLTLGGNCNWTPPPPPPPTIGIAQ